MYRLVLLSAFTSTLFCGSSQTKKLTIGADKPIRSNAALKSDSSQVSKTSATKAPVKSISDSRYTHYLLDNDFRLFWKEFPGAASKKDTAEILRLTSFPYFVAGDSHIEDGFKAQIIEEVFEFNYKGQGHLIYKVMLILNACWERTLDPIRPILNPHPESFSF